MVRSRTTARASGESRGVQPHWQKEWRMCLHKLLFYTPPFLKGRGPGGWCDPALRRVQAGSPEGAVLWRGHWGCPPDLIITPPFLSGRGLGGWSDPLSRRSSESQQESRGVQPHWQKEWRMCLHKLLFFTPPFLKGRGPGGWCEPLSRRSSESQQESRGRRPLAGALGGPPALIITRPAERKGARGMVRAPIEAKLRIAAGVQRAPSFGGGTGGVPQN